MGNIRKVNHLPTQDWFLSCNSFLVKPQPKATEMPKVTPIQEGDKRERERGKGHVLLLM